MGQPPHIATGRWSKEEHALFVKGLAQFGKEWKKVAKMITTRTIVQIRTHAQKYFQKLQKQKAKEVQQQQRWADAIASTNPDHIPFDTARQEFMYQMAVDHAPLPTPDAGAIPPVVPPGIPQNTQASEDKEDEKSHDFDKIAARMVVSMRGT